MYISFLHIIFLYGLFVIGNVTGSFHVTAVFAFLGIHFDEPLEYTIFEFLPLIY